MSSASVHRPDDNPPLCAGDRLTAAEFERRYAAMPGLKKAELVEGVVYLPSPVNHARHSAPHGLLATWLGLYASRTPGVELGVDPSLRLDLENRPQPDLLLRLLPAVGGRCHMTPAGWLEGPPELVVEVTASRASYDLHDKLRVYRRSGVREYLVWRVDDARFDWFVLREGRYDPLDDRGGMLRSEAFPGLWLDTVAALHRDLPGLVGAVEAGIATPEHEAFVARPERG